MKTFKGSLACQKQRMELRTKNNRLKRKDLRWAGSKTTGLNGVLNKPYKYSTEKTTIIILNLPIGKNKPC